jgi:HlyD family secretion protein
MSDRGEQRRRLNVEAVLASGASTAPGWMAKPWAKWAGVGVGLLLTFVLLRAVTAPSSAVRYITEPVTRGKLTVIVTATGSVQPTKKVDISSELSGTVRQVHVDYNSTVAAGQLLAELDTDKLRSTLDSTRAKLDTVKAKVAEVEATIVEKEKELARKRPLAAKQIGSIHDLDVAQAAYDRAVAALASARAEVRAAEAQLHLDETNLAKSRITSPISGTVLKRSVEPGQTVASTLQAPVLFSIAEDLKQMEVQVDVDEADVGKVKVGQKATFTVDAYAGRRFPAEIRLLRFASETIQGVVTYKAVLVIDNSELLLRPGMTATAEIVVTEIAEALLVPNASLRFSPASAEPAESRTFLQRFMPGPPRFRPPSRPDETGNNRSLWVLRTGAPARVKVEIGASDGKMTEIVGGELKEGLAVIVGETTTQR